MALTGNNGDNETNIGMSRSVSYSLYDENSNEIEVNNQTKPIEFWISRDKSVPIEEFKLIDAVNASMINISAPDSLSLLHGSQLINGFLVNGFNLSGSNASIHIQIKPVKRSLSYLTLLKFGDNPILNEKNAYYDILNLFCPNDLIHEQNDSFYLIFANMVSVNALQGYVGFSVIEINSSRLDCQNKTNNRVTTLIEAIKNQTSSNQRSFSNNYWLRIYSSGCYYINSSNIWTSYGMEILADSNVTHTHCLSNHLTSFAGGFIVLPPAINFNYVWSHASFLQNPVIYSTVIALACLYILLGIWSRYMDSKDSQKMGITILGDLDNKENKYIYEILVYTGARLNAGTTSNVSCVLASQYNESKIIEFRDSQRKLFNRAGIDSFILLVDKYVV